MGQNLLDKVWDLHKVGTLPSGQDQLFIGLHLVHEVTSPQAFQALTDRGLNVMFPGRTFATVDHIVPTDRQARPFADAQAEAMMQAIERNTREHGIRFFGLGSAEQGIVHIIGPELGLTQPGMTIACGDSHTSTHGALGSLAFGVGTSQIRDILATQTLSLTRPKVRRIEVSGALAAGVSAKDLIIRIIATSASTAGSGSPTSIGGPAIESLPMEARLTLCNMSIEAGARAGYVNPDETTFAYLEGRRFAPQGADFETALAFWKSIASDRTPRYDDVFRLDGACIEPMVAWGINPGQAVGVTQRLPRVSDAKAGRPGGAPQGLRAHGLRGEPPPPGPAGGRGVRRLVHERPHQRPARGGAGGEGRQGVAAGQGAGRAGLPQRCAAGRGRGAAGGVPGRGVPVARGRAARCAWP